MLKCPYINRFHDFSINFKWMGTVIKKPLSGMGHRTGSDNEHFNHRKSSG